MCNKLLVTFHRTTTCFDCELAISTR